MTKAITYTEALEYLKNYDGGAHKAFLSYKSHTVNLPVRVQTALISALVINRDDNKNKEAER